MEPGQTPGSSRSRGSKLLWALVTVGLSVVVPYIVRQWRSGHRARALVILIAIVAIVIAATGSGGTTETKTAPTAATATANAESSASAAATTVVKAAAKANVYVIASKSFCLASGVSDIYTGNGKIVFSVTLRNSGKADGKVGVLPIRQYDDGDFNMSPMDRLIDLVVPAGATRTFRSPLYNYEAHKHEIVGCSVKVDSQKEVQISATHM